MKLFFPIIVILLTRSVVNGQHDVRYSMNTSVYEQAIYKKDHSAGQVVMRYDVPKALNRPPGTAFKIIGIAMTFGGLAEVGLGALGLGISNDANYATNTSGTNVSRDQLRTESYILIGVGSAVTITGIVLWSSGVHKINEFNSKKGSSVKFDMKGTVGKLTWKF